MNAFNPNLLNIDLCRRYARKTRDFGTVYEKMVAVKLVYSTLTEQEALQRCKDVDAETKVRVDSMLKQQKCHRNIMDMNKRR